MEKRRPIRIEMIFCFVVVFCASITCTFGFATDTVSANQTITYNETIVSRKEIFELGFFRLGTSINVYVGIRYKKLPTQTVVWVANRNTPLRNTSGELTLTHQGVLILRDASMGNVVWSSANSSTKLVTNPIGQLLDTGNFVFYNQGDDINQENPIWQSFDFLQHTLFPGVKLGWNLVTGNEKQLTSWKSEDDPALGEFSFSVDTRGYPQCVIKEGQEIKSRVGPWNGLRFTGSPSLRPNWFYNFTFVINQIEVYYQYNLVNTSVYTRLVLQPNGRLERLLWIDSKQDWDVYTAPQIDHCDEYAVCGPFEICNINNSPVCLCLKGFEVTSPDAWRNTEWSQGCRHNIPLDCKPGEGFIKYTNVKLPDTRGSWFNQTITLVECENMCKRNCSCTAYANSNISGTGSGCLLWFGDLIDIRKFSENGDILYVRVSASELENSRSSNAGRRVQVTVPIAFVVLGILVSICLLYRFTKKKQQEQGTPTNNFGRDLENRSGDGDLELPLFCLSTIHRATTNFSVNNKLGEGGFGPVYKGVLEDGKEIAVKRLAKTSTQGLQEFKNEVILISKLQHRNLVKLLGCCIEGDEVMLIYEHMPNKGLDSFIFGKEIGRKLIENYQISKYEPKISDFGTAKTFGGNQIEEKTNRVVGTYGYVAPEYAGGGIFSIKSDVYSFGVLVLEIVSGEKNRGFVHQEHYNNLIGHAWGLYNEGRSLEFVAKCLSESINESQVLRSIHVGLLCVQRHPEDRPTMTSVIVMFGSEGSLPSPKEPGYYVGNSTQDTGQSSSSNGIHSNNEVSVTLLNGR